MSGNAVNGDFCKRDVQGAVTYANGFLAAGVRADIKQAGEDLAVIYSEVPAVAAGLFTTNLVKAAPVTVSQSRIGRSTARAIVANAGIANACTGKQGMQDALDTTAEVARALGIDEQDVFVASTGVIGHHLPMDKIRDGVTRACDSLSRDGGESAMRAIMTTDTRPKECIAEFTLGDTVVKMGGIAKGAGMIDPNVATMLSFITTDAAITPEMLQLALSHSADVSYNCLTVDGDTSTNDTVIMLANGTAGNKLIDSDGPDFEKFRSFLDSLTMELAQMIVADGEGATKSVSIVVDGAGSYAECKQIAKTVANSPLVKTALFGCDPNWGRVLAAAGRAGVQFDPKDVELRFGDIVLVEGGEPVAFPQDAAHDLLTKKDVLISLKVGNAPFSARVWTCDFSYDYVKINAEYHT